MVTNDNQIYCGKHFAIYIYINIKSWGSTPETNTVLHIKYNSILKRVKKMVKMVKSYVYFHIINF